MGQLALGTYWFNRQKKREEKKKKAVPIIFCFHYLERKCLLGCYKKKVFVGILIFEAQGAQFVSILSRKHRKVLLAFHHSSSTCLLRSQPSQFFYHCYICAKEENYDIFTSLNPLNSTKPL